MKVKGVVGVMLGAALAFGLVTAPASAVDTGTNGCTPGYWKNHTDSWQEYDPTTLLVGDVHFALDEGTYGTVTFHQALSFKGGPGVDGATRILMRATVAAFLNAAHEFDPAVDGDGYPYRRFKDPGNILATVNAALASGNRQRLLAVASWLDDANNLGCPLR